MFSHTYLHVSYNRRHLRSMVEWGKILFFTILHTVNVPLPAPHPAPVERNGDGDEITENYVSNFISSVFPSSLLSCNMYVYVCTRARTCATLQTHIYLCLYVYIHHIYIHIYKYTRSHKSTRRSPNRPCIYVHGFFVYVINYIIDCDFSYNCIL
jgi:hypothetical protein